jgi:hypothetical protein
MPEMFNPNVQDFEAQAIAAERQRRMADFLRKQVASTPMPRGQMLNKQFVAPHWAEFLPQLYRQAEAGYAEGQASRAEDASSQAQNQAAAQWRSSLPRATAAVAPSDNGMGVINEGAPYIPPTREAILKHTIEGMRNPRTAKEAELLGNYMEKDLTRQEDKAFRAETREDEQKFRSEQSTAQLLQQAELKREQLKQDADRYKQMSEDKRLTLAQQLEVAKMHDATLRAMNAASNETKQLIAQLSAEGRKDKLAEGRTLTNAAIKDLGVLEESHARVNQLAREFKPEYAGVKGAAKTLVGDYVPGVTTPASEFWKNYRKEAQLVERHEAFGATLTANEKEDWKKADISPSMAPEAIERNLARRAALTGKVFSNAVRRQKESGYNTKAFGEPAEVVIPPATAPAAEGKPAGMDPAKWQRLLELRTKAGAVK